VPLRDRELLDLIDDAPIGRPYKVLALGIMLGAVLEFFDFFLISFVVVELQEEWDLTYGQAAAMLLAAGPGAILGALVWGRLGDRYGRQAPLVAGILTFSLGTGLLALAPEGGWWYIAVVRFVVGAGVGGLGAVAVPLLVEFTPTRLRSHLIGLITTAMIPIAIVFAGLAAAAFFPLVGWRPLFAVGVLPAVLAIYVRVNVPESPRWLLERGRDAEARAVVGWLLERPVAELPGGEGEPARLGEHSPRAHRLAALAGIEPAPKILEPWAKREPARDVSGAERAAGPGVLAYRRSVAATALVWGFAASVAGSIVLWGPTFIKEVNEVSSARASLLFVLITLLGAFTGRIAFSYLPARIGRRRAGMLMGFGAVLPLVAAGLAGDAYVGGISLFVLALLVAAFFSDGGFANLVPFTPETFPTHVRAQASGLAQALNGLGRLVGPAVVAAIAGTGDLIEPGATEDAMLPAFLFLAACSLVVGIAFWLVAIETHGKDLETLAGEVAGEPEVGVAPGVGAAPQPSRSSSV
jgi:MFS transporter, putative metabolite:H+ symporter